ncbi:MAG TPA: hypothetical protein PLM12_03090, partial [Comamonas denitrificans]|nr:hypothetical protein [Comamonas denitrificans]
PCYWSFRPEKGIFCAIVPAQATVSQADSSAHNTVWDCFGRSNWANPLDGTWFGRRTNQASGNGKATARGHHPSVAGTAVRAATTYLSEVTHASKEKPGEQKLEGRKQVMGFELGKRHE